MRTYTRSEVLDAMNWAYRQHIDSPNGTTVMGDYLEKLDDDPLPGNVSEATVLNAADLCGLTRDKNESLNHLRKRVLKELGWW